MELLSRVDTVVLDKTGTVTFGAPKVVAIHPAPGVTANAVLEAAAIAERASEHALATAVIQKATEAGIAVREPDKFTYLPGRGVTSVAGRDEIIVGNRALLTEQRIDTSSLTTAPGSEIFVARKGRLLGTVEVADTLRPEAIEAVGILRRMGLHTILLSGDAEPIATAVGEQLHVDEVQAELLPDQKLARIKALRAQGHTVAMVGDGVNDAPALMQADVGVAMGSGTDVARESANIMLLGNDLSRFVETVTIARRCHRIIMANFVGTLAVDGIGVALAAFGILNPLVAAFIHVTSELAFILNSARLLPSRAHESASLRSPTADMA
jgi:Cd2+/Zn2+-exporting ATPase/Cu+-exporting ATPase